LKVKCDEPLSNVAFNINVRRYTKAVVLTEKYGGTKNKLGRGVIQNTHSTDVESLLPPQHVYMRIQFLFTFIEPQGASHGKLNQPSPQISS
jgi:hypothetical protein